MRQSFPMRLSVAWFVILVAASKSLTTTTLSWAFRPPIVSRLQMSSPRSSRKTKTKMTPAPKTFTIASTKTGSVGKMKNKLHAKQSAFLGSNFVVEDNRQVSFVKRHVVVIDNGDDKDDTSTAITKYSSLPSTRTSLSSLPSSSSPETWLVALATTTTAMTTTTILPSSSFSSMAWASSSFSMGDMDPQNFQPVCPASDLFYRFLQGTTEAVVGEKSFLEYGPLIAGGLLRIRLELCVVESFFKEAVGPFIEQNGYSWILPIHETVETFLAGTIFALAATFILVGSTKILTIISTYTDFFVGLPFRVFGGFAFDRARGKPVTLDVGLGPFKTRILGPPEKKDDNGNVVTAVADDNNLIVEVERWDNPLILIVIAISGALKVLGQGLGILREVMDGLDVFVGKYLVLVATAYIGIKFLHFKVFPDIIAF